MGVKEVDEKSVSKYGIVKPISQEGRVLEINGMLEKPSIENAPSRCAVLGRYVLTNGIFDILEHQKPGKNNEIQLTDAIVTLMSKEKVYAYNFEGVRYDIGDKFGYIKATIDFALDRDELRDKVKEYLNQLK